MDTTKKQARRAGLLYFLAGVTAPFALLYVPRTLTVPGDATATADRIRTSESLLRLAIGAELLGAILSIFVIFALYRLFRGVSEAQASWMAALFLVSIPVSLLNLVNHIAALTMARGADFLSAFDKRQLDALAYFFLRLHGQGLIVAQVFWGLWLFPFGILVIRSGFIPRFLGVLLFLAGSGYIAASGAALLLPQYARAASQASMILGFGELAIILWLLIWGARPRSRSLTGMATGIAVACLALAHPAAAEAGTEELQARLLAQAQGVTPEDYAFTRAVRTESTSVGAHR